MRHRERPSDKDRQWRYVHISGRPCRQGGMLDCNSQSENENEADNDTLPDLHSSTNPSVPTHATGNPRDKSISSKSGKHEVELISPPAVVRRDSMPSTSTKRSTQNIGDLLCTLNFDCIPTNNDISLAIANNDRHVLMTTQEALQNSETDMSQTSRNTSPLDVRKVVTILKNSTSTARNASNACSPVVSLTTPPDTEASRKVVTISSDESTPAHSTRLLGNSTPITVDLADNDKVAGKEACVGEVTNKNNNSAVPLDTITAADTADTESKSGLVSQTESTPRSVRMNPDATEIETTNLLLQLSNSQSSLDTEYDNANLMPVNAPRKEDFTRDLRELEEAAVPEQIIQNDQQTAGKGSADSDADSDKTVNYTDNLPAETTELSSPKGCLKYKHYGITRKSPSNAPVQNLYCCYCETICHSKKELNQHHKVEHTKVKCPDCVKTFPTPDALSRHHYLNKESHRFKCAICSKLCAFKSDLDLHMAKHTEDKTW